MIGTNGSIRRISGWPNEPLNSAMSRCFVSHFWAACDGGDTLRRLSDDAVAFRSTKGPSCGKCHVVVSEPWYTYMKPKVSFVELDVLENTNSSVYPTSRLACCIGLKAWMNEIIVRVIYDPYLHNVEESNSTIIRDSSVGGSNPNKYFP